MKKDKERETRRIRNDALMELAGARGTLGDLQDFLESAEAPGEWLDDVEDALSILETLEGKLTAADWDDAP